MMQKISPQSEVPPLKGAIVYAEDIEFSWDNWYSGEYQLNKGKFLNENFGYRADFVRMNNDVNYALFGIFAAPNVYEGENGHLFRFHQEDFNFETNFKGASYFNEQCSKLEVITRKLEEQGVTLILSISPAKYTYHRHDLPGKFKKGMYSDSTNYKCLRNALSDKKVNWIDLNDYFEKHRNDLTYPLYAKGGVHWTRVGAYEGMGELLKYAEKVSGRDMPEVRTKNWRKFEWKIDRDISNTINLSEPWPEPNQLMYADVIPADSSVERPNVLIVSDSYFDVVAWSGVPQGYFSDDYNYWYYNKKSFDNKHNKTDVDKSKIVEETKDRDVIVIMTTLLNLPNLSWGFIDEVYNADYP
ncbi:MAG: sugar O-acetyltransferase [Crocinitomicaceae bacterium]